MVFILFCDMLTDYADERHQTEKYFYRMEE